MAYSSSLVFSTVTRQTHMNDGLRFWNDGSAISSWFYIISLTSIFDGARVLTNAICSGMAIISKSSESHKLYTKN